MLFRAGEQFEPGLAAFHPDLFLRHEIGGGLIEGADLDLDMVIADRIEA